MPVDIGYVQGHAWVPLDEAPEIPDDLPRVPETGQTLRWFAAHGPDRERLYGAVGGDCGAEGPYIVGIWCLPPEFRDTRSWLPMALPVARYPTFDEWAGFLNAVCLPGAMMSCAVITGGQLNESPHGRGIVLTMTMALGGTPAGQRWALAHPGSLVNTRAHHG